MEAAHVKTCKLLTMNGVFHPKSNVQGLYTSRKESGWGLVSVQATILDETQNQGVHPQDGTQRQAARGMSEATAERDRPEEVPWHNKALRGMYHQQIVEVANDRKS